MNSPFPPAPTAQDACRAVLPGGVIHKGVQPAAGEAGARAPQGSGGKGGDTEGEGGQPKRWICVK